LAQRQEAIPKGGELQRKFFFTIGILKFNREVEDCQKDIPIKDRKTLPMEIKSWDHLELLNHRYFVDTIPGTEELEVVHIDVNTKDEKMLERYKGMIGNTYEFFSPVTCQCENFTICKTCFGDKVPSSTNLGSTVGAALSEGIIQSVLRTHHFGGAFIAKEDKHLVDIMRRSIFRAPDKIISDSEEDIDYIVNYLQGIYSEEEMSLKIEPEVDGTIHLTVKIEELPFNDDSVKVLNGIVGLIDRNRDESNLIDIKELYQQLQHVIEQNGILSTYLELVISLLYYDEDGILHRYSKKEPVTQIALKNVIDNLNPRLSIFYNFSNRVISKIYNKNIQGAVQHMYDDLIDSYR
jgi:hypothetical protein